MHLLTRNFACQLEQKIVEKHAIDAFGKVPRYRKIYYGEGDKGEYVTVEEFINGKFTKYCTYILLSLAFILKRKIRKKSK